MNSTKVNLGCGNDLKPGFINLDISSDIADIKWDLNNGLPPELVDLTWIYASHVLEHLSNQKSQELLKICYERLVSGGQIRLCLPDFKLTAKAYIEEDLEFFSPLAGIYSQGYNPATATIIDYVDYSAHQFTEHLACWDIKKARKYLEVARFTQIYDTVYSQVLDGDSGLRKHFSFYISAVK